MQLHLINTFLIIDTKLFQNDLLFYKQIKVHKEISFYTLIVIVQVKSIPN